MRVPALLAGFGLGELLLLALCALATAPWGLGFRGVPCTPGPRPRSGFAERPEQVDPAVVIDLAAAALAAGASVPGSLQALGAAVCPHQHEEPTGREPPGFAPAGRSAACRDARALTAAGAALVRGASWGSAWDGTPETLRPLRDALEPAWVDGVAPEPLLRMAADQLRAGQARAAEEAAARLGVRLVLPLGLCFLPSFVLLGLAPVLLAAGSVLLP